MLLGDCQLDRQQHEAVIACEDAQLVLASAGSGKTMSLMAKINYLVERLHIAPPQILVISFTKKTVAELRERCAHPDVEIRTFHGLGNSLLQFVEHGGLASRRLLSEAEALTFVRSYVWRLCCQDAQYARRFCDYLLFFYATPRHPGVHSSHRLRILFNQMYLRGAVDQASRSSRPRTLTGAPIRHKEAQLLANWLYLHQLNYVHAQPYTYDQSYRPSFTISCKRRVAYVDVIVLDSSRRSYYGRQYLADFRWRRRLHRKYHTPYLLLTGNDWAHGGVYRKLAKFLKAHGLRPRRRTEQQVLQTIVANPEYRADLDAFMHYLCSYITQFKNSLYDFCQFRAAIRAQNDYYARCRSRAFLRLFQPVFNAYQRQLEHTRSYDFADMINDASRTVQEIPECAANYRYVLLDEAQDLSPNRSQLIRVILHKNPSCRFFAVGDDWQSIYRFTGSNLALIHNFERAFELHTRRSLIEQTHRFGQPTIRLSSRFVMKNPTQVYKNIRGDRRKCTPIQIILSERTGDDTDALLQTLTKIVDSQDIQIISRYNHDIRRIKERPGLRILGPDSISWRGQNIPFCSIHKSKGITRDYVIVLNMNAAPTGMPATRENDPLSDFLLSVPDDFMFAEERRLFYVAITRARKASFLIAERQRPSPFLYEISDDLADLYQKLCPRCQIGELRRKGDISYCSNYRYGCSYIQRYRC